jgi:acyl dehydratase
MSGPVHFEDVEIGAVRRFGRYEVTPEEIVAFARQFDPQFFHVDPDAARQSIFGGLIASGWHTGAMFIRMITQDGPFAGHAVQGAMGFDDLRWLKPVRPGDVLSVESEVVGKEASPKRPHVGIVRVTSRIMNQRGEVVMSLTSLVLYRRRNQGCGVIR